VEAAQQLQVIALLCRANQPTHQKEPNMSLNRRTLVSSAAAALLLSLGAAWAAQPVVEIIAFAHPPVQSALKPLRVWLASQGNHARVVEIDMETPAGEKRASAVGVTGHVPILILVDGKYSFTRKDGTAIELKSFPAAPNMKGSWNIDDAKAVISAVH
jgi:hypothetical protein